MLPARHRLRDRSEFAWAVRGARSATPVIVIHVRTDPQRDLPARVGFVVSKAVGGAVQRNRVRRVLRALLRDRLDQIGDHTDVIVRATPRTATAERAVLVRDLDRALATGLSAARKRAGRVGVHPSEGRDGDHPNAARAAHSADGEAAVSR